MNLSDFDYNLPKELIAQHPLRQRDNARLLILDRLRGKITHVLFKDCVNYLRPGDLIVLNDTRVLPSRLSGCRITGGRFELLLLSRKRGLAFRALIRPGRVKLNEKIFFNGGKISARVTAKNEITFEAKDIDAIYALGVMPLPPYIKRTPGELDSIYYQTVYAKKDGSIASPTAGLHFTKELLKEIESQGINFSYLTLHIGYATFRPVKSVDITRHKMEPEYFKIPSRTVKSLEEARLKKARIFAVGTTTCRALETYVCLGRRGAPRKREATTDLFIYPGYKFKMVDCLLTNFHLPKTTLYMLVVAFAGRKLIKKAYQEAIDRKYRFYSYGDAMLIL